MAEKKIATNKKATASPSPQSKRRLYRLPKEGKIAGVCAGLGEYLEVDVTILRVIFVILAFVSGGIWVIVYFLMALVMPVKRGLVAEEVTDFGENVKELASDIEGNGGVERMRFYVGLGLVVFGIWLLLDRLFPELFSLNWGVVWPALLVIFGVLMLVKGRE